jgi:hypothetical protein
MNAKAVQVPSALKRFLRFVIADEVFSIHKYKKNTDEDFKILFN